MTAKMTIALPAYVNVSACETVIVNVFGLSQSMLSIFSGGGEEYSVG